MSITSLLLHSPIPRESIALGRLVLDPKYPDHEFFQPSFQSEFSGGGSGDTECASASYVPDVATQRVEDFNEILYRTRGTRLELSLLNILSIAPSNPSESSAKITATHCITHQLRNASAYFSEACRQQGVREWLEDRFQRQRTTVYMVCGFKTLTDAWVELAQQHETGLSVSASIDTALVSAAAGVPMPIPLDSLSLGGILAVTSTSGGMVGYKAVGEQVFAVQYRKIRCSWFSTRKVDNAYLEQGNRWKSCISLRAGQSDVVDDGVDSKVSAPLGLHDLMGPYESFQFDGEEEMLYRSEENTLQ